MKLYTIFLYFNLFFNIIFALEHLNTNINIYIQPIKIPYKFLYNTLKCWNILSKNGCFLNINISNKDILINILSGNCNYNMTILL